MLCGGAIWIGGEPNDGIAAFGVMAALALVIALGGRSELIRGLRGDGRAEYWDRIDTRATTFAGLARAGPSSRPARRFSRRENPLVYGLLLLLAEATQLTALAVLNRRS